MYDVVISTDEATEPKCCRPSDGMDRWRHIDGARYTDPEDQSRRMYLGRVA